MAVGTRPTNKGFTASVTSTMDNPSWRPNKTNSIRDGSTHPQQSLPLAPPPIPRGCARRANQAPSKGIRLQNRRQGVCAKAENAKPRPAAERKCFIMLKRNGCKGTTNRPAVMLHDRAVHQAGKAQSVDVWQEAELLAVAEHLACEIVGYDTSTDSMFPSALRMADISGLMKPP